MMRIGIFTDTYLPDVNGVATSSYTLCQTLIKHGHEVFVITTELPDDSQYQDENNVLRLPGIEIKKMYGYRASNIFSFKGMKEIKNFGLDVIHIQTEFGIGIFGKIAAQILNVPVVYTYHTMYEDYSHYIGGNISSVNSIVKKAVSKISRIYGDNCTELVVPSMKTKEVLENYGIEKEMHVVPTGLMLDHFDKQNIDHHHLELLQEKYHLQDKFVICFVGRLAKEKSVEVILEAISHLTRKKQNICFLVVGDGPALEELQQETHDLDIEKYVQFVGAVAQSEVPYYYHLSNAFVSASITETQGLTFIEAQAAGTIVLARHDKNLEEVIIDGRNGIYFDDELDLANKIEQIMEQDLSQMKENAYQDAKKYGDEVFYQRIYEVYQLAIQHLHYCYKVSSIFPLKGNMCECIFKSDENEISLHLSKNVVEQYGLFKGKIIERDEFDALQDYEKVADAYHRALKWLTIKDYTKKQMIDKLNNLDLYDDIQIDMTIHALMTKKLINDREYTKDYFDRAARLGLGLNKTIMNLRQKGIEDSIIEEEKGRYHDDIEYTTALELVDDLYQKNTTKSKNAIKKTISDKLYRRGFSSHIINKVMSSYEFCHNEELEEQLIHKELNKAYKRYRGKYEGIQLSNKITQYLLNKGFDYSLVKEVIKENSDE